jgi:hypothetical protein
MSSIPPRQCLSPTLTLYPWLFGQKRWGFVNNRYRKIIESDQLLGWMLVTFQSRTSRYGMLSLVAWWKLPCTIIHEFAIGALGEMVSTKHDCDSSKTVGGKIWKCFASEHIMPYPGTSGAIASSPARLFRSFYQDLECDNHIFSSRWHS